MAKWSISVSSELPYEIKKSFTVEGTNPGVAASRGWKEYKKWLKENNPQKFRKRTHKVRLVITPERDIVDLEDQDN